MTLLVDVLPGILARKSLEAGERLVRQLYKHFQEDRHLDGSPFVKLRLEHKIQFGLSPDDTARTEIGQINTSVSNMVPAAFWRSGRYGPIQSSSATASARPRSSCRRAPRAAAWFCVLVDTFSVRRFLRSLLSCW